MTNKSSSNQGPSATAIREDPSALLRQMRDLNKELKGRFGSKGICTVGVSPSAKAPSSFVLLLPQNSHQKQSRISLMKKGHNAQFSVSGLYVAYGLADRISTKIRDGSFSHSWLNTFLDKDRRETRKTIGQWARDFLDDWWETPVKKDDGKFAKKTKQEQRYISTAESFIEVFSCLPQNQIFDENIVKKALHHFPDNQTGKRQAETLKRLLDFAGFYQFHHIIAKKIESAKAGTTARCTYVPTDREIIRTFYNGYCLMQRNGRKKGGYHLEGVLRQRWLFGLLAVYGMRIHEAWMVMNWIKPVEIRAGEFIEVDKDTGDEEYAIETIKAEPKSRIIPAFFDSNNKHPLLVVRGGKTGKRITMPLSPQGQDWIEVFGLKKHCYAYLPNYKEPLKLSKIGYGVEYRCTSSTCRFFLESIRWDLLTFPRFTAHKLRHAYTHRGRLMGINPQTLALSQGHLTSTADLVYARHFADERTLEAIQAAQEKIIDDVVSFRGFPSLQKAQARADELSQTSTERTNMYQLIEFIYSNKEQ